MTLGWAPVLDGMLERLAAATGQRFTNIVHPSFLPAELAPRPEYCFLRQDLNEPLPEPDLTLLSWLEQPGVPTVHNMIVSDRIVATIAYHDALRWATLLARRLREIFEKYRPDVVIGAFDGIHSSISLAVARRMNIPWYAMNFTVLPPGYACFVDQMNPASRIQLHDADERQLRQLTEQTLAKFERRDTQARAFITPPGLSLGEHLQKLPARLRSVLRTVRLAKDREALQFTHGITDLSVKAAMAHLGGVRRARHALAGAKLLEAPPSQPFIMFGLHMQPESSIDVWAPWVSNQMWVIEWLARSIPPSHKLLVKIHKSDAANYSTAQLRKFTSFPGVELVQPFADARRFVEACDVLIAIQGTMALEAAMLGKPVIMLADSPTSLLPSVTRCTDIEALAPLIRQKIGESRPSRERIADGLAEYLRPFMPASYNDWDRQRDDREMQGYAELFRALRNFVVRGEATRTRVA
jgi:hypothetical protein